MKTLITKLLKNIYYLFFQETRPCLAFEIQNKDRQNFHHLINKVDRRLNNLNFMQIFYLFLMINFFSTQFLFSQNGNNLPHKRKDGLANSKSKFPNAVHLTRQDINELVGMIGNDPNGIASLLSLQTGLTFRNTGDAGSETWFIVRNFGRDNSRMTLVLLDGRPINLGNNHTVEFDDIPLKIVESITIYPGPVPVEFGGFQSVIDIKTIRNEEDVVFAETNIGSLAGYRFNTTLGKTGRLHYLANFDLYMSQGQSDQSLSGMLSNFRYTNREIRTFLPTFKVGYELFNELDITLQGNFVDFKKMFHTRPLFGMEASRKRVMHNYSVVFQPGRNSKLDYQLIAFQNRENETLNPIFPEDTTYNVHWGKQNRTFTGLRGYYRLSLFENMLALKAGGEVHWTKGSTDDNYLYFKYVNKQNFYGVYVQTELSLWESSLVTLGLRADAQNGVDKTYVSPVGSIAQSLFNDKLTVYASYGVQRRWIPLNEVNTFNRPARVLGPPFLQGNVNLPVNTLDMERFVSFDGGVKAYFLNGTLSTRVNYFYQKNEGQFGAPVFEIRPINPGAPGVPPTIKAALVASDRNFPGYDISQGLELEVETSPLKELNIFANATYFIESKTEKYDDIALYEGPLGGPDAQNAINNSIGKFYLPYHGKTIIPGAYDLLANFGATYRPDSKTIINSLMRYRGKTKQPIMKFGINPQTDNIPSSLIVDASIIRDIFDGDAYSIKAIFSVSNLFNSNYQTFVHYPMQRRYYSLGLSANIK